MSFSSLEAGYGSSGGAVIYPLRTLVRDLLEREIGRELDACLDRTQGELPERIEDDFEDWLRSDDSPLLLLNVPEFVLDPEAHLRALAEQIEGGGRTRQQFTGTELVRDGGGEAHLNPTRNRAEELRARLRTFAEADAERILATPRRRGTPKGKTRTHLHWLISPDQDISNRQLKLILLEIICRRWPGGAKAVGYIHRDTDNTHLHIWLSAELLSGKKISVMRATPSGDPILDKYPDLDEEVARAISRHFNDPSIYEDHMAKKLEWVHWRERFEETLRKGERPPIMPHRARHDFDWVGERKAISNREREEKQPRSDKKEKAAPVPRTKSVIGTLELYGKTIYLEAKVKYRRALLESLEAWRDTIDYPITGVKQYFERELEKSEREHERYKYAFERTLENRARKEYPELKYALHNTKQIAEMTEIARLTRDAELLRYVRLYTQLERPIGSDEQVREMGERWRDEIEERLEVFERGEMLERVTRVNDQMTSMSPRPDAPVAVRFTLDKDAEIVHGWLRGGWTTAQMQSSMACFEHETKRRHGERYLKAREYLEAVEEAFIASRADAENHLTARPALEASHFERIIALLSRTEGGLDLDERTYFGEVMMLASDDLSPSLTDFERLSKIDFDKNRINRAGDTLPDLNVLRPHDERWVHALILSADSKAISAFSLAACENGGKQQLEDALADFRATSAMLELARSVRLAADLAADSPSIASSIFERRSLETQYAGISQHLRGGQLDWTPDQIAAIEELKDYLPPAERQLAERALIRERARHEEHQSKQHQENLNKLLASAGELYLKSAYRIEGYAALSDPERFKDRVTELTDRYLQIINDAGIQPETSRLDEERLRERARLQLNTAIERYGHDERECETLSELQGRTLVAEHASHAAQLRREWFEQHWAFVEWRYETIDGSGRASVAGIYTELAEQLALDKRCDNAQVLVCESEREQIAKALQPQLDQLRGAEERLRTEFLDLQAESQERHAAHLARGLRNVPPSFTLEELANLETYAVETKNRELIQHVSSIEEENWGLEYAAERALGRSLAAETLLHGEYNLPSKYDRPPESAKLASLPAGMRADLTGWSEVHTAARSSEKSAAQSYSQALKTRTEELIGMLRTEMKREARPLLSVWEAELLASTHQSMDAHSRYRWEGKLERAQVEVPSQERGVSGSQRNTSPTPFKEWRAHNHAFPSHEPAGKFLKFLEGPEKVLSYREAQVRVRSLERSSRPR